MEIKKNKCKQYMHYFLALGIFTIITLLISRPMSINLSGITSSGGEEYLVSYIISWVRYIVQTDISRIFTIPFMYPTQNTLAFSDYFISQGIISIPFYWISGNPIASYNLLVLLALILNPMSFYIFSYQLTKNAYASLLAAVIFGFTVGRFDALGHLQVFSMYWVLFGLSALVKYFSTKHTRYSLLLAFIFLAQGLDTVFMTFVLIISLLIVFVWHQVKIKLNLKSIVKLLMPMTLSAIMLSLLYLPYLKVSKTYNYTRTLNDIFGGSAYWADYLYPSRNSNLRPLAEAIIYKQPWTAYMGFVVSLLVCASIVFCLKKKKDWKIISALSIFFSGLILSFGPFFQVLRHQDIFGIKIPLPYLLLYYSVPGFKSMRVPQRWSHLAIMGACLLIALMASEFFKRIKNENRKRLVVILLACLVVFELQQPLFSRLVPESNSIYKLLGDQSPGIVLELPATTYPYPMSQIEIIRLYQHSFLLDKEHKYINGYSGFAAPIWTEKILGLQRSPAAFINSMSELNPDYLLINMSLWDELSSEIGSSFYSKQMMESIKNMPYTQIYEESGKLFFLKN